MIIKIILPLLLLLNLNIIDAKNYNEKTNFFLAKKLFNYNEFNKSEFILKNLLIESKKNNKYMIKAKLLKILINYKKNNLDIAKHNILQLNTLNKKCYTEILYLKSIIFYNLNVSFFQKFFKIKNYKHDQTYKIESLIILKKLKNLIKNNNDIKINIRYIKNNLILKNLEISSFYIKKKIYLAALNRLKIEHIHTENDCKSLFLILKCYNELFLNNLSKKLLENIKIK